MTMLNRSGVVLALVVAAALGGWFYRAHFDRQATQAALAAANAKAEASIAAWRSAADKISTQALKDQQNADAQSQALQDKFAADPAGNARLSPFLLDAAKRVYSGN